MASRMRPQKSQPTLPPDLETRARRFAEERLKLVLSTKPGDEQQAEHWLRRAYQAAGLVPPAQILWLDGPLQLVLARLSARFKASPGMRRGLQHSVRASVRGGVGIKLWERLSASDRRSSRHLPGDAWISVWNGVTASFEASGWTNFRGSPAACGWYGVKASFQTSGSTNISASLAANIRQWVWGRDGGSIWDHVRQHIWASKPLWKSVEASIYAGVRAYEDAPLLACYHLLAVALVPNDFSLLARFNEQVSGYWLEKDRALVVRRPRVLERDAAGRLHSATGRCLEYRDGWGIYAWHGVRVPEKVILAPEQLTREDFSSETNIEVRRVIQERMGERFVLELGTVIDTGPRGTLYEAFLPGDSEGVARYVQVQDTSSPRQYVLRVPPTVQTAAEAVAWSFHLSIEEYGPVQEA